MHARNLPQPVAWLSTPVVLGGLALAGAAYSRGWRVLHARNAIRFPPRRLAAFLGGLAAIGVAIASPLDTAADRNLAAHMVQHLVLLVVAPPLLLLGAPLVPLMRGLPRAFVRAVVRPIMGSSLPRWLTHPAVGLGAMFVVTWGWHVPAAFELALRSDAWHAIEHACFLGGGLLYWWHVVQPWPSRPRLQPWAVVPYLLLGDLQNTALGAVLTFADRIVYPSYAAAAGPARALADQVTAGVIMWVPMSLAYLVPAAAITVRLLSPRAAPRLEGA